MKSLQQNVAREKLLASFAAAVLMVFLGTTQAFANGLPAGIAFFPGMAPIDPVCGPLLTVAIAIIERPFFARAGLTPWALIHSLRANFASYLLGIVVTLIYVATVDAVIRAGFLNQDVFILLLPIVLISVTIWFEERLAVRVLAPTRKLRTRWIIAANVVSNLALFAIMMCFGWIFSILGFHVYELIFWLEQWQAVFIVAYLLIFFGGISLALGVPLWKLLPQSLQRKWGIPLSVPETGFDNQVHETAPFEKASVASQAVSGEEIGNRVAEQPSPKAQEPVRAGP
ncbi:MAG TPA: hypothetical protein PKI05_07330 [Thermogutta sp.]|nr:hypothetical protein [Thermogutta sp.]